MDDNLRYKTINNNAYSIVKQISHQRLVVYPDFKDRKPWSVARKSRYIESIMLGIPSQPIWCEETPIGDHHVIDGSQRIETLNEFLTGVLSLKDLRVHREYNGCTLRELPYHEIANIEDRHLIPFIIVNYDAQPALKCEFYWRLFESDRRYKSQVARNFGYRGALPYLKRLQYETSGCLTFSPASKIRTRERDGLTSKIDEIFLYLVLFTSILNYASYIPNDFTVENLLDSLMERLISDDMERENWASEITNKIWSIAGQNNGKIEVCIPRTFSVNDSMLDLNHFYELFLRYPSYSPPRKMPISSLDNSFSPTATAHRFVAALTSIRS